MFVEPTSAMRSSNMNSFEWRFVSVRTLDVIPRRCLTPSGLLTRASRRNQTHQVLFEGLQAFPLLLHGERHELGYHSRLLRFGRQMHPSLNDESLKSSFVLCGTSSPEWLSRIPQRRCLRHTPRSPINRYFSACESKRSN